MYKVSREFDADVPPHYVLDVVWDVETYPEFVKGVSDVELLEDDGGGRRLARFSAGVTGLSFKYVLEVLRDEEAVRWQRLSGSFRAAEGSMVHLGERRFRYTNALDPGFAVPEFAVRFVLERSLPRLIREFKSRARRLHEQDAERDGA